MTDDVLGLPDLQGVYDSSLTGVIALDTTRGALDLDGAALAVGRSRYFNVRRGATDVLSTDFDTTTNKAIISSDALAGLDLEPGLFPGRTTLTVGLDQIQLLPTSRTLTSTGSKIDFGSGAVISLDFVNATFGAALGVGMIAEYLQDGNVFGGGLVVNHNASYQGNAGATRFIGPVRTFVHQPFIRANGAVSVVTQNLLADFLSQPQFRVDGGATSYTLTGRWSQFVGAGRINASATITERVVFHASTLQAQLGTLTDVTALEIANLQSDGPTNPAMGITNQIATPGIQYEGSTGLWGVFAATPVGQRTDPGALTDSTTGTANNTVVAVPVVNGSGATTAQEAAINDNFADVSDQINQLRQGLVDLGWFG